jgi:O-antigen ligase
LTAICLALAFMVFWSLASGGPANLAGAFQLDEKVTTLNYEAAVLLAVVTVAALLWRDTQSMRPLMWAALVAALGTILVARYLNAIVALLPALATLFWHRFAHRRIALTVAIFAATGIVVEVVTRNIKLYDFDRLTLWRDALRVWTTSPILGVGPGNLTGYVEAYSSFPRALVLLGYHGVHNTFLELLAENGLLGLGVLAAFLALLTRQLVQGRGADPADHRVQASALGLLSASGVMAFLAGGLIPTVNSAGWSAIGNVTLVWLVSGLAVGRLQSHTTAAKTGSEEVTPLVSGIAARTASNAGRLT